MKLRISASASVLSGKPAIGRRLIPMESEESGLPTPLAHRVDREGDATQIADAVFAVWQKIDAALSPIVGTRGVAALYKRSLYLCGTTHPRLAALHEDVQRVVDLDALKAVLARQSSSDAASAVGSPRTYRCISE